MRIIDTTGKMLVADNHPSILLNGKAYIVDDRKSTFDKIQKIQNDKELSDSERDLKVFELALGKKEAKEIMDLDLSVKDYVYFTYCVMGAITGEDPDEMMKEMNGKK
jgi:hypothetical protein